MAPGKQQDLHPTQVHARPRMGGQIKGPVPVQWCQHCMTQAGFQRKNPSLALNPPRAGLILLGTKPGGGTGPQGPDPAMTRPNSINNSLGQTTAPPLVAVCAPYRPPKSMS